VVRPTTKSGAATQEAIDELANMRDGWSLLAATDAAEFLRQVKARLARLEAALRELVSDVESGNGDLIDVAVDKAKDALAKEE
jgi:hypothetical protein